MIARQQCPDFIVIASVTLVLCVNLIGPAKVAELSLPLIGTIRMSAGVVLLPLMYLLSKVVYEVYGKACNSRITWAGFMALTFAVGLSYVILSVKPATDSFGQQYQQHLEAVFGNAPRVAIASLVAYICGMTVNSGVISSLRARSEKNLWLRMAVSALCAHGIDTVLFYTIAFYGIWSNETLFAVCLAQYMIKVSGEFLMSPVAYWIARTVKQNRFAGFPALLPIV